MTMPNVTAPHPIGAAGRPPSGRAPVRLVGQNRAAKRARSFRDLTPFVFLAMILIPSLIVLCLAIADPGAKAAGPSSAPAVAATPGP